MCVRRLSLKRVRPSLAVGLYAYRVITMGSPLASASGPGAVEVYAMRVPSGDQARRLPARGSTAFVPCVVAKSVMSEPSARATATPLESPTRPVNAIHLPSGDQRGLDAPLPSAPSRVVFPVWRSRIQISDVGRRPLSFRVIA